MNGRNSYHLTNALNFFHAVPLQGCLLLATEEIWDGPFHQSVILVLSHDHELGTVGLILNRPGAQRLDSLAGLKSDLAEVFSDSLVSYRTLRDACLCCMGGVGGCFV